ncbi:hypothetical protein PTTG_11800 [Puccinia triticina 1-1 BBBD Race 1]|uniref:RING-type domain-containing protein n=1 Tax=Puccinia triticina (isolate 1-1 / race 1 (BBBD)) TaxID=630390 RepID=A0A180GZA8_PUCT1|nr:hypothetical protein PTTG_11800 [Puccinia triticina 1-1 BBBD Race 1]WAR59173.1 hypothetical protein PtB15_10B515 [Puccinia triticina]
MKLMVMRGRRCRLRNLSRLQAPDPNIQSPSEEELKSKTSPQPHILRSSIIRLACTPIIQPLRRCSRPPSSFPMAARVLMLCLILVGRSFATDPYHRVDWVDPREETAEFAGSPRSSRTAVSVPDHGPQRQLATGLAWPSTTLVHRNSRGGRKNSMTMGSAQPGLDQEASANEQEEVVTPHPITSREECCPVCLEEWVTRPEENRIWNGCGHEFHTHCVGWEERCPLCRRSVSGEVEPDYDTRLANSRILRVVDAVFGRDDASPERRRFVCFVVAFLIFYDLWIFWSRSSQPR